MPLFDERALLLEAPETTVLVAGDLHLGIEKELRRKGVHGLDESKRLVDHLEALAVDHGADRIVLLGDVKHSIGAWESEARAVEPLTRLQVPVEVVPGNHDGGLADLLDGVTVHASRGLRIDEVGLIHGHTWPTDEVMAGGRVVLCHNHPSVALRDDLGGVHTEPCWVRAPLTGRVHERYPEARLPGEAFLVPAFNPLLGGVALNRPGQDPLGPLLENDLVDLEQGRAFTLDGVDLGTLASLTERYREAEEALGT